MPSQFEQIIPGLFHFRSALRSHHEPVNSFLLQAGDRTVVIDPAADLTENAVREITALPVTDIMITHVQRENAAGCANFPQARVHVPAGDEYLCEGAEKYPHIVEPWPPPWEWETRGNFTGHVGGARNERPPDQPIAIHGTVAGADPRACRDVPVARLRRPTGASLQGQGALPCPGKIIATPGHGKHAVTIIASVAGKRVAFCGDVICGNGTLWNWFDSEWDYGLQHGQRAVLQSAELIQREQPDILCPTHGPVVDDPSRALDLLRRRLETVLAESPPHEAAAVNFPDIDSPAPGFRRILPHLHQYRAGNCVAVLSDTGNALIVDDGLCYWEPLPQRAEHHRAVINDLKRALGIRKIDLVIPSHCHGDHTENIPELIEMESCDVACVDTIAETIEHPERFNVIALLPWYGTAHDTFAIHRKLKSGERLRWHEYEIEMFMLGGQTWYTHGIDMKIDGVRTLFIGDSLGGFGTACESPMCYNDGDPATRGWAFAIDRMIEHRPDLLVCGHGIAMRDPMPFLLKKQAAWNQRLAEFAELSFRKDLREFFDPFGQEA
ncbi:MAG TPA: MBL fold metallo-hydrolase [Planctomycetota bacterium]|nr:MBL fold metallo-hydrolase [Planctomycetota bacterium]